MRPALSRKSPPGERYSADADGVDCRKFPAPLRDSSVTRIVVEHRDRFCRFSSEYVQAAMAAQGQKLVIVEVAEVHDDLVRDMTKIRTSMCVRLYGRRGARNRAMRAITATKQAAAGPGG